MKNSMSTSSVSLWRLVIIEDSPEDCDEIRRLLLQGSDRRYQFVEAETGAAGVRAILDPSNRPPDCVVLDYTLPDTDAMEVLRAVIGSDGLTVCPVVVLTGTAGPQFGPAVLRAGAQDFIGKSWMTAESLTRAVDNAAERWTMTRELQAHAAALHFSEAQLQLAVEVAGLGVTRIDYVTNTVILDTLAAALFGLIAEESLPRSVIHATFHPDDKTEIFRLTNQSLDPGGNGWFVMEHRVVHPDGSIRWLSVKKQVIFGDISGVRRPVEGVLAAVDITERKMAEEMIARQALYLDSLYTTVPTGLFQFDADLRFVRLNAWTAAINGQSVESHIGRTVSELLHPEVARTVEGLLRQVLQTGEPALEIDVHGPSAANGQVRDWLASYYPVRSADGEVIGVHGVILDITERKQSEAALRSSEIRFRRLFEAAKDGVLILDGQTGKITDANPSILEVLGSTRAEVLGQELWEIGVFADAIASRRAMVELQDRGCIRYDDLPLESKTGLRRDMEVVANVYKENGHRVIQFNFRDITERKATLLALRQSEEKLREADRTKDEFLATLAHELRNPLAPVRNSLELLKWENGNPELHKQARETMERQIGHMVRLIDDLLDVSRISSNKLELKRERVELASVIYHAVEACQPHLDRDKHEFLLTLPTEVIQLYGDPTRLAQVIGNLLTNACKYSEPGGKIWLTAEREEGEVKIVIQDEGIGIPPEMLHKVFDMFTQIDKSLERSDGGLGIGLSLVKRLVELHGGTVTAHSQGISHGSEFTVKLPIEVEQPRIELLVQPPVSAPAKSAGRRILVVDDNRDSATTLALLLKMSGNQTETAFDGLAAVETAEAFRPDVILLDIGLPKMNGHDTCRVIRQQPWGKDILILALTGWGQEEDRRKTAEAGFDNHLVKPVDHIALNKLISESELSPTVPK